MILFQWMFAPFKKYAKFSGRARRTEYWLFYLLICIMSFALTISIYILNIGGFAYHYKILQREVNGPNLFSAFLQYYGNILLIGLPLILFFLAIVLPWLAVTVRRLHDQDKSGWWIFIYFAPMIGPLWLLVLMALDGTSGPNQYGPDPKAAERVRGDDYYNPPPHQSASQEDIPEYLRPYIQQQAPSSEDQ